MPAVPGRTPPEQRAAIQVRCPPEPGLTASERIIMLKFANQGQDILETNYWDTPKGRSG